MEDGLSWFGALRVIVTYLAMSPNRTVRMNQAVPRRTSLPAVDCALNVYPAGEKTVGC